MAKRYGMLLGFVLCGMSGAQAQMGAWQIGPWARGSAEPVIRPRAESTFADPMSGRPVHWEALHTFNPAAVVRDGKVVVLYRAEDDQGTMQVGGHTSRLGLAESTDGVHFTRLPEPVLYPAKDAQAGREWTGGVEDPRLVEAEDGTYVLTYTQWSPEHQHYTIGIATSRDLRTWVKHGPAFAGAAGGKYDGLMYKSGAMVTRVVPDGGTGGQGSHARGGDARGGKASGAERLVAAKIQGKYWMYWGEIEVRLATSADLVHWTPVEDASGKPVVLLRARPGRADSGFPEAGPPPVLGPAGIIVLYNAKNAAGVDANAAEVDAKNTSGVNPKTPDVGAKNAAAAGGDATLAAGTYSVGEALFAADDPAKLLARTADPVFKPELPFERSGQYAAGTTFAEGLVLFRGRWWMYYGCADSFVGVATAPVR